ncbi:MAG: alpha-amylase family glycosyl hydrolase, partial [Candidatus Saccharimonadales bacterium]
QKWWEGAVAYQIYPKSFLDTNGDGTGDLNGIINRLDYLAGREDSLGVDAVWISPFYPSPMVDSGYDVSDFKDVDPAMGNMGDFDRLIDEAHSRDLKVIIDLIPNHTSDQHPWFAEARSSRDNPKRDWYVWHNDRDGKEPNNWVSVFGGPAWQFDEQTGQYYLHSFSKEQPDLNWQNPEVRRQMLGIVDYWLDKGVDGLRVDAVAWLSKDPRFTDDPPNPNYEQGTDPYNKLIHSYSCGGPELFNYLNEIAALCAKRGDRFMITESYPDTPSSVQEQTWHYVQFYENLDYRYCAPFNFEFISSEWDAKTYRQLIDSFQAALLPGWPQVYAMGNHDKPRLASRLGKPAARTAATLLLSLPGLPFIYYGDEIGMTDVAEVSSSDGDPAAAQVGFDRQSVRTPMQWSTQVNAGFSQGEPWLPAAKGYKEINAAAEGDDPKSDLSLYKQLLKLRRGSPALSIGDCQALDLGEDVLAYSRNHEKDKKLVLLNFSETPTILESPRIAGKLVLSNYLDNQQPAKVSGRIELRANEAVIIDSSIWA